MDYQRQRSLEWIQGPNVSERFVAVREFNERGDAGVDAGSDSYQHHSYVRQFELEHVDIIFLPSNN